MPSASKGSAQKLGVDPKMVQVDLFASHSDAHEEKYMIIENSAWKYNWHSFCQNDEILWANPPFEDLEKVVTKACRVSCRMVWVSPNLLGGAWKELLQKITVEKYVVAPGIPVYESAKSTRLLPGRHWETVISFIDTTKIKVPKKILNAQ